MNPLTLSQLLAIMPHIPTSKKDVYLVELNKAMPEFDINTPTRVAAFLAQLAHESGELRWFEELSDGKIYEGRKDLGNTMQGDGPRFKGRGPIQLTGRNNYTKAGQALGVDLIAKPWMAAAPEIGFRTAGWFWNTHALNPLADSGNFTAITKIINGGFNGLQARINYFHTACKVLAVPFVTL
jgi:putative chitinase